MQHYQLKKLCCYNIESYAYELKMFDTNEMSEF